MCSSNRGALRDQVNFLRRQFLQDGDLPFTDVLTEDVLERALATLTGWLAGHRQLGRVSVQSVTGQLAGLWPPLVANAPTVRGAMGTLTTVRTAPAKSSTADVLMR